MPLLMRKRSDDGGRSARNPAFVPEQTEQHENFFKPSRAAMLPRCSNPRCASGWLRLWRSRSTPVFEGGWCCAAECTRARVEAALSREMSMAAGSASAYRHRIPLGLSLLEKGWITADDLRRALEAQRAAGCGRFGQWLIRNQAVSEAKLARALALQWSCPVLGLELEACETMASLLPRLFVDALGALPLRIVGQRMLYVAFEDRPDPVLAVAMERMTGLRVESGILDESGFRAAHARVLNARYPAVELLEAASESGMVRSLTQAIEDAQPVKSRLVRVHDFLWLRIWTRRQAGAMPTQDEVRDRIFALTSRSGTV